MPPACHNKAQGQRRSRATLGTLPTNPSIPQRGITKCRTVFANTALAKTLCGTPSECVCLVPCVLLSRKPGVAFAFGELTTNSDVSAMMLHALGMPEACRHVLKRLINCLALCPLQRGIGFNALR